MAYAASACGIAVTLVEVDAAAATQARNRVEAEARAARLAGDVATRVSAGPIVYSTSVSDVAGCRWIVENVTEDPAVKMKVYRDIGRIAEPDVVLAANTSAIPIRTISRYVSDPSRMVGIHFMNPVSRKPLVELVQGEATAPEAMEQAYELLTAMDKKWVMVADHPGFVINRILMLTVNEAVKTVERGTATAAQIDVLFRGCLGHAMGPLRTADLIGLDTVLRTLKVLRAEVGDDIFAPAELLQTMVAEGRLGRKSGSGFFEYAIARGFANG